jgi:hypothetical protein
VVSGIDTTVAEVCAKLDRARRMQTDLMLYSRLQDCSERRLDDIARFQLVAVPDDDRACRQRLAAVKTPLRRLAEHRGLRWEMIGKQRQIDG